MEINVAVIQVSYIMQHLKVAIKIMLLYCVQIIANLMVYFVVAIKDTIQFNMQHVKNVRTVRSGMDSIVQYLLTPVLMDFIGTLYRIAANQLFLNVKSTKYGMVFNVYVLMVII